MSRTPEFYENEDLSVVFKQSEKLAELEEVFRRLLKNDNRNHLQGITEDFLACRKLYGINNERTIRYFIYLAIASSTDIRSSIGNQDSILLLKSLYARYVEFLLKNTKPSVTLERTWAENGLLDLVRILLSIAGHTRPSSIDSKELSFDQIFPVFISAVNHLCVQTPCNVAFKVHGLLFLLVRAKQFENIRGSRRAALMREIDRLIEADPRDVIGQGLLHWIVDHTRSKTYYRGTSITASDLIDIVVSRGYDVNAVDDGGNTPLILLVSGPKYLESKSYASTVTCLLEKGSHVDMKNKRGICALQCLKNQSYQFNETRYLPLKCLAANRIIKCGLNYRHILPKTLTSFVDLHISQVTI